MVQYSSKLLIKAYVTDRCGPFLLYEYKGGEEPFFQKKKSQIVKHKEHNLISSINKSIYAAPPLLCLPNTPALLPSTPRRRRGVGY